MNRSRAPRGFSLIELAVAVVIVGILASVALPSYQEHLRATRRTDATLGLTDLAARLERHYTETNDYSSATIASGSATDVLANADTAEGLYTLSIVAADTSAMAFTIKATRKPSGVQVGDRRCGDFTLTDTELRGVSGSGSVDECW